MAPRDPRCPHCDGPVSGTSSYCMHCGKDIESPARIDDSADVSDADDYVRPGDSTDPDGTTDGWLDPDGLLDDVSTVAVAGVAAILDGVIGLFALLLLTGSAVSVLLGLLGAVGVGLWVGRNRSVFGAVRNACYATAAVLGLVPFIALGPAMNGGTLGGRLILLVIAAVVIAVPALLLVGVGYAAGKRRPESIQQ